MEWLNSLVQVGATGRAAGWLPVAGLALLILVLAAAEHFSPLHREQVDPPARIPANFGLGIINMSLVTVLPVTGIVAAQWSSLEGFGLLHVLAAPPAVSIAVTLVARSFLGYWLHRLAHRFPLLWRMHRVHHCDIAVDVSTGFRHHPMEVIYVTGLGAGVAAVLGLSPLTLAVYEVVALGFGLWTHANTSPSQHTDRGIAFLLVTPAVHHVHHSAHQPETDSNYGDVFTLWDRLFGTFRAIPLEEVRGLRLGLGEAYDAGSANILVQLGAPFRASPKLSEATEGSEEARMDRI